MMAFAMLLSLSTVFTGCSGPIADPDRFSENTDGLDLPTLGNVFILGDSYSTFQGYIPQEHSAYYSSSGRPETDVDRVEQTWWYQLLEKTGSSLILNHSWSGTTICNTGYAGADEPNSFIRRFDRLAEEGFFEEHHIDTVLVMGGQNDDWADAPIGKLKTQDWTEEDLLQYGPALCYLMHRMKTVLPDARIIFVVNSNMSAVIRYYQYQAADLYDIEWIRLENIQKTNGHPTIQGMQQIAEQVLDHLKNTA